MHNIRVDELDTRRSREYRRTFRRGEVAFGEEEEAKKKTLDRQRDVASCRRWESSKNMHAFKIKKKKRKEERSKTHLQKLIHNTRKV